MAIIVVRHGETAGNARRIVQKAETPLNAQGERQAERVAQRLTEADIGGVLASDLPRASRTAEVIAAAVGADLRFDALLQERNFGDLRGMPYDDIFELIGEHPFGPDYVPPAGESWQVFYERVANAWDLAVEQAGQVHGDLVVVTHGLVCRALAEHHLDLAGEEPPAHFGNTAVTIVHDTPPHSVRTLNCTAHLDAESADDAHAVSGI